MIGNIYKCHCKPSGYEWGYYHFMPLESFEAVKYRDEDLAYTCLILEVGVYYKVYADELRNGTQVG